MSTFQNFTKALASRYSGRYAGLPVRPVLRDLERVEPGPLPEPAVQLAGEDRQPGRLREARRRRLSPGSRPATRRHSSPSARRRRTGATSRRRARPTPSRPGTFAEGRRQGEQDAEVRRLGAPPVPGAREPEADPEGACGRTSPSARCRSSRRRSTSGSAGRTSRSGSREYGNETKPGEPAGVTEAQQAPYLTQAIDIAKKDPRVPMFVWFVMRDSTGSLWQSGIYRQDGRREAGAAEVRRGRQAARAPSTGR